MILESISAGVRVDSVRTFAEMISFISNLEVKSVSTGDIYLTRANACKIFCFKFLNYYLKNAQNGKILLGGIMLLRESLEEIDDFRVKRCRKFELADIFLLVLFGLLSGIKDIEHIAEWAE